MRLRITKSKNVKIYYVIKTIYINKKEKTITIERLGTRILNTFEATKIF